MRREERVTVQGPVKEQQPDGMSHRGALIWKWGCRARLWKGSVECLYSLDNGWPTYIFS